MTSGAGAGPGDDPVVVVGLGAVTPLGADVTTTWAGLLAGRSAVRHWPDLAERGHALDVAARVDDEVWVAPAGADGTAPEPTRRGRDLGIAAATEALATADLAGEHAAAGGPCGLGATVDPHRLGCFVGTTMGESTLFETAADRGGFDLETAGGQSFAESIGGWFGIEGPRRTLGTACAAGNYAIGAAARAVASGRIDVALAGGVEPFSQIAMVGFARMRAMAPGGCTPFGLGRRGMTLGEAAAFLVLCRASDAAAMGWAPMAVIGGLGLSADAHHPTAPREDGRGMAAAMTAGLQRAGVRADQVGWVSAHGTGTPRSDAAEALALRTVFGSRVPPVSGIKGALGHSLGAATAVEAVAAVRSLTDQVVPPTAGTEQLDPDLGLEVPLERRSAALDWVLSCGFAFGGLNSALLVGRAA